MTESKYLDPNSFVSGEHLNCDLKFEEDSKLSYLKDGDEDLLVKLIGWRVYSSDLDSAIIKDRPLIGRVYLISAHLGKLMDESPIAFIKTGNVVIAKNTFIKNNFNSKSANNLCKQLKREFCLSTLLQKQEKKLHSLKKKKEVKDIAKINPQNIDPNLVKCNRINLNLLIAKQHKNLDLDFKKICTYFSLEVSGESILFMLKGWSIYSHIFDPKLIKNIPSVGSLYILSFTDRKLLYTSPISHICTDTIIINSNISNKYSITKYVQKIKNKFCLSTLLEKQEKTLTSQKERMAQAQALKNQAESNYFSTRAVATNSQSNNGEACASDKIKIIRIITKP